MCYMLCCIGGLILIAILAYFKPNHLKWIALVVLGCGFYVYFEGFNTGEADSLPLILRSLLSSTEMFVGHSDLVEIGLENEEKLKDPAFMMVFSTVHFAAVYLSITAILAAIGSRFKFFLKLIGLSLLGGKRKTYVFWGVNEASLLLAKDIRAKDKREKKDRDARFIFVQMPDKQMSDNTESVHDMFSSFKYRHDVLRKIKGIGDHVHLAIANRSFHNFKTQDFRLYDETLNPERTKDEGEYMNPNGIKKPLGLFEYMGLRMLRRVLLRRTMGKVSMFFLSDDADFNLYSLHVLCSDQFFNDKVKCDGLEKIAVYCQARRDNVNLLEEYRFLHNQKLEVHVVDPSYLSVFYLKNNECHLPINYVEHENGVVTSAFNSLIIGFGETGQDCLRFLYEDGAFLGPDGRRSPFHCTVMDARMDEIKGTYLMKTPALKNTDLVDFESIQVGSEAFWERMSLLIKDMNYIVVALGDDEKNISLAINLYEFAIRERSNQLENFTIYVRSYRISSEKRLNNIADYCNRNNQLSVGGEKPNILIFGEMDEIYTCERIAFEDEEDECSKEVHDFYEVYRRVADPDSDIDWKERRRRILLSHKNEQIPLLFRYRQLVRMESQDYANWMHMKTKFELLGVPRTVRHIADLEETAQAKLRLLLKTGEYICTAEERTRFEKPDFTDDKTWSLIVAICKTEHLRWVAAHEMMGYAYGDVPREKRDMLMLHGEMKPWEELSDVSRIYDLMVLFVSVSTLFRNKTTN